MSEDYTIETIMEVEISARARNYSAWVKLRLNDPSVIPGLGEGGAS